MEVYILVRIDDEYGHQDFRGVFLSREAGEEFFKKNEVSYHGLYNSLEQFQTENGCEGFVLFEVEL